MTSLDPNSPDSIVIPDIRADTNDAFDWFWSIAWLIENNYLAVGDVLVCDNASIHYAQDVADLLSDLLEEATVRLVFLPTYSPELNPCEFVFAQVKRYLRSRRGHASFTEEILNGFAQVTRKQLINYYFHCTSTLGV
jgi:transposase